MWSAGRACPAADTRGYGGGRGRCPATSQLMDWQSVLFFYWFDASWLCIVSSFSLTLHTRFFSAAIRKKRWGEKKNITAPFGFTGYWGEVGVQADFSCQSLTLSHCMRLSEASEFPNDRLWPVWWRRLSLWCITGDGSSNWMSTCGAL